MSFTIAGIEKDLKSYRREGLVRGRLFSLRKLALGATVKSVALEEGMTQRTLQRWKARYVKDGAVGLLNQLRCGRPRAMWLRGRVVSRVLQLRKKYGWGAEVIQAHLKKIFGIEVSMYRINELLRGKNLLKKPRRKMKNKHTRKVKIFTPGKHTQMDVRHLDEVKALEKRYVYNFVDHASKWTFKHVYDSYGPSETKDFMQRIFSLCPFAIERLQTDNGIEFTNRFVGNKEHVLERLCKEEKINLKFIPPGEKELQGLVEGHHRIDKDEFFTRIGKQSVEETNKLLKEHLEFRNNVRGFKTNGWMSPNEYLVEYAKTIFATAAFYANKKAQTDDQNPEQILIAA
jgi:transposase